MIAHNSLQPPERIASIDILRGLTILVMIFVNDVGLIEIAPAWMKHHHPGNTDGMTFVDVVFPAFLFIVGMSIPFALGRRLDRGESPWSLMPHIATRTFGLLVIGIFMVNTEYAVEGGALSQGLWTLLMYTGVLMVWNAPPRAPGAARWTALVLRAVGITLLIALAILYCGEGGTAPIEMRPYWLGILGLIGRAYFLAAVLFLLLRRSLVGLLSAMCLLYCINVADREDAFASVPALVRYIVDPGAFSLAAITVSGILLGSILAPDSPVRTAWARARWGILFGLSLCAAGLLLHSLSATSPMWHLSKIRGTPPWCLLSSGITCLIWVGIYWLVDMRGIRRWSAITAPAGANPLFAYILAPMLYAAMEVAGLRFYERLGENLATGLARAVLFAFGVTFLAGWLRRAGLRMRL